jgi:hypothetical protein
LIAQLLVDSVVLRSATGISLGASAASFIRQGVDEMWRSRRAAV